MFIINDILNIPFSLYKTFIIEEKFGFNKTNITTYLSDKLKGYFLAILIGGPVLYLILYFFSTVYHSLTNSRLKAIFRRLDHSAIYILIAGTYTPVILISLRSTWVIYLLPIIWLIAIIGIYMKIQFIHKYEKVSLWIYITMGWLALIAIKPLLIYMPLKSFVFIIAGGIIYTIGIAFYVRKKLPYHHVIWHIFVLIGSTFHYIGILYI